MEEVLVKYFLGQLTEEEEFQLEEEYFADEDKFEELKLTKTDLIDAYVANKLTSEQCNHFEKYFLASPEHRQQLEIAQVMATFIATRSHQTPPLPVLENSPPAEVIKVSSWKKPVFISLSAAALLVVSLGVSRWLWVENNRLRLELESRNSLSNQPTPTPTPTPTPALIDNSVNITKLEEQVAEERKQKEELAEQFKELENTYTKLKKKLAQSPASLPLASFILNSIQVREGGGSSLVMPSGKGAVKFQLYFISTQKYRSFQVEIFRDSDGKSIWNQADILENRASSGRSISLFLPNGLFQENDYTIKLKGLSKTGLENIAAYSISTTK